jgi:hypothetical protein
LVVRVGLVRVCRDMPVPAPVPRRLEVPRVVVAMVVDIL